MVVPLDSTDVENSCSRVRAVQDYAVWILSNPQVEQVAEHLDWAIMPLKIAQQAVSIVKNMTCTTRQAACLLPRFGSLRELNMLCRDNTTVPVSSLSPEVIAIKGSGSTMQEQLQGLLTSAYFIQVCLAPSASVAALLCILKLQKEAPTASAAELFAADRG